MSSYLSKEGTWLLPPGGERIIINREKVSLTDFLESLEKRRSTMKHPHADLMKQYAEDAQETDKPWERWEVNGALGWTCLDANPSWCGCFNYRRKPRTININGHEVPEPMRVAPGSGTRYWVPVVTSGPLAQSSIFTFDTVDIRLLNRGLCHSTREAAEAHARALLSFTDQS